VAELLVLAAFSPELAAVRSGIATHAVGIGLPAAAVGTAMRLEGGPGRALPRMVVLIGTCGVYPSHEATHPIGSVVAARRVLLVEPACVEGRAAFPGPLATSIDADGLLGADADVATTLAVTTDDALATRICTTTGCAIEHLEAFGVASACAARGVRFAALLGVANVVGSRARDEWRANHRVAGDAAAARVHAWLDAGAPGL
jgi:futalosine hydrolase